MWLSKHTILVLIKAAFAKLSQLCTHKMVDEAFSKSLPPPALIIHRRVMMDQMPFAFEVSTEVCCEGAYIAPPTTQHPTLYASGEIKQTFLIPVLLSVCRHTHTPCIYTIPLCDAMLHVVFEVYVCSVP